MTDKPLLYTLTTNEKTTPLVVYTSDSLIRGELVTRSDLRVSAWLRMSGAPEYLTLKNVQRVCFSAAVPQQDAFSELYLPAAQVLACHVLPPAQEPPDYDESEPNRKMEPVFALVGGFRLSGRLRMPANADLKRFLDVTQAGFLSLYTVEISNPALPAMGVLQAPLAWARKGQVILGLRV